MPGPAYCAVHCSGSPPDGAYTLVAVTGTAAATPGTDPIAASALALSPSDPAAGVTVTGAVSLLAADAD
jgi:hypothetical protein